MSCLSQFPPIITDTSTCEFDSILLPTSCAPTPRPDQIVNAFLKLSGPMNVPSRHQSHEMSLLSGEMSARNAFLPPKDDEKPVMKRLLTKWWEEGFFSAVDQLVSYNSSKPNNGKEFVDENHQVVKLNAVQRLALNVAKSILASFRMILNIHSSFNPHLMLSGEEMISHFSEVRDWPISQVRGLAWHPHTTKLAIAFRDDTIQVLGLNLPSKPLLKFKKQKSISCLAWKPFNSSDLAVGCQCGIVLWNVEPSSVAARPSASSITLLTYQGHAPVTSVSWDPNGKLLLSSSAADTSMILWNPSSESNNIPLRRVGGGGVHLVSWAHGLGHILAATPSKVFRVWESRTWTHERWNVLEGYIKTGCWSPCGSYLLFSTSSEPIVFLLNISNSSPNAVPLIDLSKIEIDNGSSIKSVGGLVQSLRWDPLGERLAVSFVDSDCVAIFCTNLSPTISISPIGLIGGLGDEIPSTMEFAGKFDEGALLTIAWSSGRIQNVPLLFVPNLSNVVGYPNLKVVLNSELELRPGLDHQEVFSSRT